jgi:streptomycin 6-kinase
VLDAPGRDTKERVSGALEVPELVRRRALSNGSAGRRWLDELPDAVAHLASEWDLEIGAPFSGGTASYVVATHDQEGRECVLKVAMPLDMHEQDAFGRSVIAHQLAGGQGCAELLRHSESPPAMLIERLGQNLDQLDMPVGSLLETIAATLRSFWRPVGPDVGLPTARDQAAWLAVYIESSWNELGRPCERVVVDRALEFCATRSDAFDETRAVLVHGDAHGWNTLEAGGGHFKFVDPEGLRSDREHDLAIPMREYNEPLLEGDTKQLVSERAKLLAGLCDADPRAVWEWGFVERVSTGLANLKEFTGGEGIAFLEVARRCL